MPRATRMHGVPAGSHARWLSVGTKKRPRTRLSLKPSNTTGTLSIAFISQAFDIRSVRLICLFSKVWQYSYSFLKDIHFPKRTSFSDQAASAPDSSDSRDKKLPSTRLISPATCSGVASRLLPKKSLKLDTARPPLPKSRSWAWLICVVITLSVVPDRALIPMGKSQGRRGRSSKIQLICDTFKIDMCTSNVTTHPVRPPSTTLTTPSISRTACCAVQTPIM